MTFIEQFEQELARRLEAGMAPDVIVQWASERVLESHRNGIASYTAQARKAHSDNVRRGIAAKRMRESGKLT